MAISIIERGVELITVEKASIEEITDGHAYWINRDGTLLDAGTNIAVVDPTHQPADIFDLGPFDSAEWALHYGVMTGSVGGKVALAELWPIQPVDDVAVVPPFKRDVASHYVVPAGMGVGLSMLVDFSAIPSRTDVIYDGTSADNGTLDSGPIVTEDYSAMMVCLKTSGGTSQVSSYIALDDGTYVLIATGAATASATTAISLAGDRMRFSTSAAGAGNTVRLTVFGRRTYPVQLPRYISPYLQFTTKPTTASDLRVVIRGKLAPRDSI